MTSRQFCTLYLDGQCYGLDVLHVQEIVRCQPLTQVPLAHPVVRGLINLRGQIVTAIDLRRRMGLPDRSDDREPVNVVVEADDGAAALIVDDVGDVVEVAESDFERPPDTVRGAARELVLGAYKLPDQLLVILDTPRILTLPS